MTAVVAALSTMADAAGTWWGTKGATSATVAQHADISEETVRRLLGSLRSLGVFEGPVHVRRGAAWEDGYQEWRWRLLRPNAVITKDPQGFFVVSGPQSE